MKLIRLKQPWGAHSSGEVIEANDRQAADFVSSGIGSIEPDIPELSVESIPEATDAAPKPRRARKGR